VLILAAPRVVTPAHVLAPGAIVVDGGRIIDVVSGIPRGGADAVLLKSGLLIPGLVDLQVNGAFGVDLVAATADDWHRLGRLLPTTGVTAFLATFITAPIDVLTAALGRARAARAELQVRRDTAQLLGVHLEGPFLSSVYRGAHDPAYLVDPTAERLDRLLAAGADGLLALSTLAPERSRGIDAVRRLADAGVLVSVGHSDATADVVAAAAEAGARMVTHLFNAQRGIHHREPGVAGQALVDPRLTSGLIADLHHVAPQIVRLAFTAAPGRIALVTDSAAAAGMSPGRYELGGQVTKLPADGPPLRADGTIAGSALRLDHGISNAVAAGVDLVTAIDAASRVPADLVRSADRGRLTPGARADLVWLGDDLHAQATWIDGQLAWSVRPIEGIEM
jgi:N-acetylglucosamine-6-phosphate deacetylase